MQPPSPFNLDYQHFFQTLPGLFLVISPELTVMAATDSFLAQTGFSRETIMGQSIASITAHLMQELPLNHTQAWQNTLQNLVEKRQPLVMQLAYIPNQETGSLAGEKHWQILNTPVFQASGALQYIIHEVKDITTAYVASEEARLHKERFEMVAQATNDAIWDWNLLDNTVIWNENYQTLFGYPAHDGTINSWLLFIHPEDKERVTTGIHTAISGGSKYWSDEYRFKCADGSYSIILDRGFILFKDQNQPYRMVGSMQDISIQRKAENQVKKSSDFFQFLADTAPAFIWTTTPEGITDYRNKYYLEFTGKDQNTTFHFSELLPPDKKVEITNTWKTNLLLKQPFEMEVPIRNKSGEYRWTLARAIPRFSETGEILKWMGIGTDIHDHKKALIALEESTRRFTFLADTVPAFIWTSNPDGSTDYRNRHYYEYIGFKPEDEATLPWQDFIHPDDRDNMALAWQESVKTGHNFNLEQRIKSKDGVYNWFLSRAHAMRDDAGNILKWFGTSVDIQDQKLAQQKLVAHDAQLQRMLDEAPLQLTILRGPDLIITYQNNLARQSILNRNLVGLRAQKAWPEMEAQGFLAIIKEVYLTGKPFVINECYAQYELSGQHDLTSGYFNFSYQPLRNLNQEIEGILCFSVDVTEQVKARQELERLAEDLHHETDKFRILAEAVPQFVWAADPAGNTDYFNQRWADYTGLPLESVVGENWGWLQVLHPNDFERTIKRWQKSITEGVPYEIEYRLKATDNQFRWFLGRAIPMHDADGNITKWLGTCTDIHDQKIAQQKLEESAAQFQFLADTVPQLIWTTQPNGFHDYFNRRWTEFTGYNLINSLGQDMWNKLLHPDDQERANEIWTNSLTTGQDYQIEYRFKRAADGEWRWFLARAKPMRNDQGEIIRWFGTCTEIHEQKLAQESLQEANRELKQINEDLDLFVYTASHDLKLPIINMGGIFDELMRISKSDDPDHGKLVNMFHKSLDQIHATITDLSEIAKVQKNINSEQEIIPLEGLLSEIELSLQEQIQSNKAQITKNLKITHIQFSRVNLRSIFYNMVSNALKYRHPDRPPVIELEATQVDGYIVVQVKDNGLGIDLKRHGEKLFQMFKRFHNHVPGTGLGLYIVNRILQNNNGFIQVESNPGQGSTFRIYFKTP